MLLSPSYARGGCCFLAGLLLIYPGASDTDGEIAHTLNDSYALGNTDGSASVEKIEQVRTLEAKVIGGKERETAALLLGKLGRGGCLGG